MKSIEEMYEVILREDKPALIEYLSSITTVNRDIIDKIDNLSKYAVSKGKTEMLKVLVCYGGHPASWNNFSMFYFNLYGSESLMNYLQNGANPCDCKEE